MLLGSAATKELASDSELLIIQFLLQHRYAEAYNLAIRQGQKNDSMRYNIALCLHWSGNYEEAIKQLDAISQAPSLNTIQENQLGSDFKGIVEKQKQTSDYLHGMSESYIAHFPELFREAIIRLKTDCWIQLQDFAKVIATARPIQHRGYKNIIDALKTANSADDKRI